MDFPAANCRHFRLAMQRWLTKLTPEQAAAQGQRIAAEAEQRVADWRAAIAARPPPRGPGRPAARSDRIAAASTADELSERDAESESTESSAAAAAAAEDPPNAASRGYTSWVTSEWFPFIHNAVQRTRSLRGAVRELQQRFPRLEGQQHGVFDRLAHGTLQRWYEIDSDGTPVLREEYQRFLPFGRSTQPLAGGGGFKSFWDRHPGVTTEIRKTLSLMRDAGASIGVPVVRWVIGAVAAKHNVSNPPLSRGSVSEFARNIMHWSWRTRTTAAGKLPDQARVLARRVAAAMELGKVPASNVVNIDQTGIILIPAASHTYEQSGLSSVPIAGAEEKRQITAVLGSTLAGEFLPLQLVFEGKTARSRPEHTSDTLSAGFHLTNSENHWSTLQTMQEYVNFLLEPWRRRQGAESRLLLLLDAWSVHRSKEFREWMAKEHKHIDLIYIPANCTGVLQVADVALNRPFKAAIRREFGSWGSSIVTSQIAKDEVPSLRGHSGIRELRPLVLQWCFAAWQHLSSPQGKLIILHGWQRCIKLYADVEDAAVRAEALTASVKGDFRVFSVPQTDEQTQTATDVWEGEEDVDEADAEELDLAKPRAFGDRRSKRKRSTGQRKLGAYMIDSSQIELSDDE